MSWIQRLYQTYDVALGIEGVKPWPVSHFVKTAHIEVVLDAYGNYRKGRTCILEGDDALTLIPATESSAGRAGAKVAPHPLCEELSYCAKDLEKSDIKKYEAYLSQLEAWNKSKWTHPKVQAVFAYIKRGCLWADISSEIEFPIKFSSASGNVTKINPDKAFIRWRVEIDGDLYSGTWDDQTLIESWSHFDQENSTDEDFCLILGERKPIARNHPRFLRFSSDGAKLVSSNDSSGYTFRGRFTDTKKSIESRGLQGSAISSIATQKAHNALRWLIGRKYQTFKNGEQVMVTWALSNNKILAPFDSTPDDITLSIDDLLQPLSSEASITEIDDDFTPDQGRDIGNRYAKRLNSYMRGYIGHDGAGQIKPDESVSILALDSATPGRMGISYYREILPEEYIATITQWHTDFAWPQRVSTEANGVRWLIGAPKPKDILRAVYGGNLKSGDSLSKQFYMRLLPCIVEKQQLPKDFWERAFRRACNRQSKRLSDQYSTADSEQAAWEKDLAVACALYKGFTARQTHGEINMALDTSNTSRDYLYGRLLAVAEKIEEVALSAVSVNRATAASRLMQRFTDKPASTWLTIYKQLDPYMRQLKVSRAGFLTNMNKELDQIMATFKGDDFANDGALKPEFLLGFHCQRLALSKKAQAETQQTETEEGI
mgnify:CR=1 FL=1